jgi:hypothetical protein
LRWNTAKADALSDKGPDEQLAGTFAPPLTRCLDETRLNTFIRERSRAWLGMFTSARHGDPAGQLATELGQQHAIEPGPQHVGHTVRSERGTSVFFGLDVLAVKPKLFI